MASHDHGEPRKDPVCGMSVKPTTPHRLVYGSEEYLFCSPRCLEKFRADPERYLADTRPAAPASAQPQPATTAEWTCPMHPEIVRDAPGTCPICGMALEPRDADARRRAENPELVDMTRRFWVAAALTLPLLALAMGEMLPGEPIAALLPRAGACVARARARDAGRALGRLAVLRARLAVGREPQPQHVHADRARRRRRVRLQRRRDARAGPVPACVPRPRRRGRRLLRGGRGDRHARPARPGARAARAQPDRRGDPRAARPAPQDGAPHRRRTAARRTCRSSTCTSAIGCACGPARRCRSTASCSRARASVDESMVTGEPIPVEKQAGDA